MTGEEFIKKWNDKWNDSEEKSFWSTVPEGVFWAQSYNMPSDILLAMSLDYLTVPMLCRHCSSYNLAVETIKKVKPEEKAGISS